MSAGAIHQIALAKAFAANWKCHGNKLRAVSAVARAAVRGKDWPMTRCAAQTTKGRRCLNQALSGEDYCAAHNGKLSPSSALAMLLGGIAGNAIAPGFGGVIAGAFAGTQVRKAIKGGAAVKERVFVSFDFDHDRVLKDFIIGQARLPDSPFDIFDHSLKEAAPERDWVNKARSAIRRAEIVLVITGTQTYRARGVLQEVAIAREEAVPIVQIIGYKDRDCRPVPDAGRVGERLMVRRAHASIARHTTAARAEGEAVPPDQSVLRWQARSGQRAHDNGALRPRFCVALNVR